MSSYMSRAKMVGEIDKLTFRLRKLESMRDDLRMMYNDDLADDEWHATLRAASVRLAMVASHYRDELNDILRELGRQPMLL